MCGFAAVVSLNGSSSDPALVERMTAAIRHRGPDDEGAYASGGVAFGFRRLSILDLTPAGHQPMSSPQGDLVIVFNGEIFNYVELRRELEALGHEFRSTGDTEVLLAAYREWGRGCLPRLNGMWAFLVHDRRRGTVFGARDRFGIKPLYWTRCGDRVLFGSEIKALRASGLYRHETDWEIAAEYLIHMNFAAGDSGERTFFRGIEQILPGTAFELDLRGSWDRWRYWSLAEFREETLDDPVGRFAEVFDDSVRLRLRSDVPVGVSLSGGLDSTSILCTVAERGGADGGRRQETLEAFCYHAPDFDETPYVEATIARTGARLNRLDLEDAFPWTDVSRILRFYDQPVQSTAPMVGFHLMGLAASRDVVVVLTGQGADEVFAGYDTYFRQRWHTLLASGRFLDAWREVRDWAGRPAPGPYLDALHRLGRTQLRRSATYRTLARARQCRQARRSRWFVPELAERLSSEAPPFQDLGLREGLRHSVECDPLPLYLRIEDRNSMAHSIEARLPFLDYRLVALAFSLGDEWKIRGATSKRIVREAMRGRIPEVVRARPDKMGFPTQARDWFAGPWYEPMQDLLASRRTCERGIYRVDILRRALEAHRRGEINVGQPLMFDLAQFELWAREAEDGAPSGPHPT